jgi:hypothetical protein
MMPIIIALVTMMNGDLFYVYHYCYYDCVDASHYEK